MPRQRIDRVVPAVTFVSPYSPASRTDVELRLARSPLCRRARNVGPYTARRLPPPLDFRPALAPAQPEDDAFAAERRLKGWSRAKKEALIAGDWALVSRLARNRQD